MLVCAQSCSAMILQTSRTSYQNWRRKGRRVRNLTVDATQSRLKTVCQTLTNGFKTLLYWSQSLHSCATLFGKMLRLIYLHQKLQHCFTLNSSGVEDEILTLQADIELKSSAHGQFLNLLTEEKYPNMRKCATSLTALFGSTYLCESAFSHMKISSETIPRIIRLQKILEAKFFASKLR